MSAMSASWMISSLSPYLNAPTFHDVVFHVNDAANSSINEDLDDQHETVMYAHAVVLCGRSPTFHALFTDTNHSIHSPTFTLTVHPRPSHSRPIHIHLAAPQPYSRALKKTFTLIIEYFYTNVFDIAGWLDSSAVAADVSAAWIVALSMLTTLRVSALSTKISAFAIQNAPAAYGAFLQRQRIDTKSQQTTLSADDRCGGFFSMNSLRFGRHSATRGVYIRVPDTSDDTANAVQGAARLYGDRVMVNGQRYIRYKVDPLLLAARSPYFAAMFGGAWKESQTRDALTVPLPPMSPRHRRDTSWLRDVDNDIILTDCTAEQFDSVVHFIYTDEIHERTIMRTQTQTNTPSVIQLTTADIQQSCADLHPALSLLSWSVVYQMSSLSEYVQSALLPAIMTTENVCSLWAICLHDMFQVNSARPSSLPSHSDADVLHEHCRLMVQTHFRRVIEQPNFYTLPMPLLKSALDSGMIDCDSATMCAALERWIDTQITYKVRSAKVDSPRSTSVSASSSSPSCMLSAAEVNECATAYRLALFPPATLFNRSEKRRILGVSNRSFFARMNLNANAAGFNVRARV